MGKQQWENINGKTKKEKTKNKNKTCKTTKRQTKNGKQKGTPNK